MGRLLAFFGGLAWLVVIVLGAVALQRTSQPRVVPRLATVPALIKELNDARLEAGEEGRSWVVTRATSAHNVLVVTVDARRAGDARAIAARIVQPVLSRGYDEILVYVRGVESQGPFADRRVQWTPAGGYAELVMGN